jgi:NTP pyrophosphatase (non-canonical NTP hydrolase)
MAAKIDQGRMNKSEVSPETAAETKAVTNFAAPAVSNSGSDSLEELKEKVRLFCEEREWDQFHDLKDLAIGLVTESAELLDLFRFKTREECEALLVDSARRERVLDEVADVLFFVLRLSGRYQLDLGAALEAKMRKNAAKYPVEKSRGSNRKYDEF